MSNDSSVIQEALDELVKLLDTEDDVSDPSSRVESYYDKYAAQVKALK